MRLVIQRVRSGSAAVAGVVVGQIGGGLVVLIGITHGDTPATADLLANKLVNLRIFNDAAGKMNRSALNVAAEVLVISQFTLYADARKGRRPSFVDAAPPTLAASLYQAFAAAVAASGLRVATGQFQTEMLVEIWNDGPVTIVLDSADFAGKD